jgi:hypothetical protein
MSDRRTTPKPKVNEALLRCEKIYWAAERLKERNRLGLTPFVFFGDDEAPAKDSA